MGGRFSVPKAPDGINEDPKATAARLRMTSRMNVGKTIIAPAAGLSLAAMFLFFSRTEPKAAKIHAEKHRAAGGGEVDWRAENLRRHGELPEPSDDKMDIREALIAELEGRRDSPDRNYQGRDLLARQREEKQEARLRQLLVGEA